MTPLSPRYSGNSRAAEDFQRRIWRVKYGRRWEDMREWASLLEDVESMVLTKLAELEGKS